MARTIDQIKTDLKQAFMQETTLQEKYGFAANADFDSTFSRFSIESLLRQDAFNEKMKGMIGESGRA